MTEEQLVALIASISENNDWASLLAWLAPFTIAVATGVSWLFQEFYKSRLQREMEGYKLRLSTELQRDVETHKARLSEQLQNALGDNNARREYEAEARKRLYREIGPLRFQLLLACRDAVGRIERLVAEEAYSINMSSYFGRNTVYRILRPIALCDLIESRMALADFSLDIDAIECLRLRRAFEKALSSEIPIASLPGSDWSSQTQHVFAGKISQAAQSLVLADDSGSVLRFHEFEKLIETAGGEIVAPFQAILENFSPGLKPILWVRLIAFSQSANRYLCKFGADAGFEYEQLDIRSLLASANSSEINARMDELVLASNLVADTAL
ncbi:hypothetical protein [Tropicibacter oceani]|uniref:Uncharacterized protein n=1 Tax=Tropicibacter oceani TaxID=3058420 RepID=A0ABY8QIY5_9RHOB|nr:hypothetical protein [Tropicibacter oceani]WGW03953.1 hypothetical protein QF118_18875 [Tropicibacter oceani]